jgi:hypothetical protein
MNMDTVPSGYIKWMVCGRDENDVSGQLGHVFDPTCGIGPQPTSMLSGFSSLVFDDEVTVTFYKEDGAALYTAPPIKARRAAGPQAV